MMGRDNGAARWCILRTRPAKTIELAASLASRGIDAWTPIAVTSHTRDRVGSRLLPKPQRFERTSPIMPSFVFAPAIAMPHLDDILLDERSPHPPFSFFRHAGRIPLISERSIAGLRGEEERTQAEITRVREEESREVRRQERIAQLRTERAKRKALRSEVRDLAMGQRVAVADAPAFAGMTGVVEQGNGRSYFVSFGGSVRFEIEAWRLSPHDVEAVSSVFA